MCWRTSHCPSALAEELGKQGPNCKIALANTGIIIDIRHSEAPQARWHTSLGYQLANSYWYSRRPRIPYCYWQ